MVGDRGEERLMSMSEELTRSFEVRWDDVDPRDLLKAGVAGVSLGEEVRYLREVFPLEVVTVASRIVGLSADGARWRFEHTFSQEGGEKAAVVRTLGAWIGVGARRIAPTPAGVLTALEAARAADCETLASKS
ncbi:thioesterase family protein [Streptomyces sp. 4503]|uniref:Thioesterase family protein n=1 Tax=Streptomyces niphimycinicus TaxID=2842201 RepID=A0ABS6CFM1_9ACTN|nr:thioesterase family protein [Streptomyces niphimycinicus]MBU3865730.1 thioesterase family protein [Streptomyces niphimycinicus]